METKTEAIVLDLRSLADEIEQRGLVEETAVFEIKHGIVDITDQVGDAPYHINALSGAQTIIISLQFADWQDLIARQIKRNQELLGIEPNEKERP